MTLPASPAPPTPPSYHSSPLYRDPLPPFPDLNFPPPPLSPLALSYTFHFPPFPFPPLTSPPPQLSPPSPSP
ncbi:hypothetical protein BGS_1128 [Beggiatoa sp. SS]|nr:hypothetical protein BGS_1128 [Beggiatoa sp. SS]